LFFFFSILSVFSQKYVDMSKQLSHIDGHIVIDGNKYRRELNTREEIIITGKDMVINGKSSIILNEVIVQLSGEIMIDDEVTVYPKFLDSYIFCKASDNWESKNIIVKSHIKDIEISKVKYIKKIKGNPKISIYDCAGKNVFKGSKEDTKGKMLSVGRYDLRIQGQAFQSKLPFY